MIRKNSHRKLHQSSMVDPDKQNSSSQRFNTNQSLIHDIPSSNQITYYEKIQPFINMNEDYSTKQESYILNVNTLIRKKIQELKEVKFAQTIKTPQKFQRYNLLVGQQSNPIVPVSQLNQEIASNRQILKNLKQKLNEVLEKKKKMCDSPFWFSLKKDIDNYRSTIADFRRQIRVSQLQGSFNNMEENILQLEQTNDQLDKYQQRFYSYQMKIKNLKFLYQNLIRKNEKLQNKLLENQKIASELKISERNIEDEYYYLKEKEETLGSLLPLQRRIFADRLSQIQYKIKNLFGKKQQKVERIVWLKEEIRTVKQYNIQMKSIQQSSSIQKDHEAYKKQTNWFQESYQSEAAVDFLNSLKENTTSFAKNQQFDEEEEDQLKLKEEIQTDNLQQFEEESTFTQKKEKENIITKLESQMALDYLSEFESKILENPAVFLLKQLQIPYQLERELSFEYLTKFEKLIVEKPSLFQRDLQKKSNRGPLYLDEFDDQLASMRINQNQLEMKMSLEYLNEIENLISDNPAIFEQKAKETQLNQNSSNLKEENQVDSDQNQEQLIDNKFEVQMALEYLNEFEGLIQENPAVFQKNRKGQSNASCKNLEDEFVGEINQDNKLEVQMALEYLNELENLIEENPAVFQNCQNHHSSNEHENNEQIEYKLEVQLAFEYLNEFESLIQENPANFQKNKKEETNIWLDQQEKDEKEEQIDKLEVQMAIDYLNEFESLIQENAAVFQKKRKGQNNNSSNNLLEEYEKQQQIDNKLEVQMALEYLDDFESQIQENPAVFQLNVVKENKMNHSQLDQFDNMKQNETIDQQSGNHFGD